MSSHRHRRTLSDIQDELQTARSAFERYQVEPSKRRAPYRSTPGCAKGCRQCDIACAVIVGCIGDLEAELKRARTIASLVVLTYDTDADVVYVDAAL